MGWILMVILTGLGDGSWFGVGVEWVASMGEFLWPSPTVARNNGGHGKVERTLSCEEDGELGGSREGGGQVCLCGNWREVYLSSLK